MTVSRRENLPGSVRDHGLSLGRYEGRKQLSVGLRTPGAGLIKSEDRKAPSDNVSLEAVLGKTRRERYVKPISRGEAEGFTLGS